MPDEKGDEVEEVRGVDVIEEGAQPIVLVDGGALCLHDAGDGLRSSEVHAADDVFGFVYWLAFVIASRAWQDVENVEAFAIDGDGHDGDDQ